MSGSTIGLNPAADTGSFVDGENNPNFQETTSLLSTSGSQKRKTQCKKVALGVVAFVAIASLAALAAFGTVYLVGHHLGIPLHILASLKDHVFKYIDPKIFTAVTGGLAGAGIIGAIVTIAIRCGILHSREVSRKKSESLAERHSGSLVEPQGPSRENRPNPSSNVPPSVGSEEANPFFGFDIGLMPTGTMRSLLSNSSYVSDPDQTL